jgi:hypothetical protein
MIFWISWWLVTSALVIWWWKAGLPRQIPMETSPYMSRSWSGSLEHSNKVGVR